MPTSLEPRPLGAELTLVDEPVTVNDKEVFTVDVNGGKGIPPPGELRFFGRHESSRAALLSGA
jgi:hypothetical protein